MAPRKSQSPASTPANENFQVTEHNSQENVVYEPVQGVSELLDERLEEHDELVVKHCKKVDIFTSMEVKAVGQKLGERNNISEAMALKAIVFLLAKGGSNKGSPGSLSVEIRNPDDGKVTTITKSELENTLRVVVNSSNVKPFARALAPDIINFIKGLYKRSGFLLKGDLANTIDKRLVSQGKTKLTPEECICCASYTQHMDNLDTLAGSRRLLALLYEDELARFTPQKKTPVKAKPKQEDKGRRRKQQKPISKSEKTSNEYIFK